MSKDVLRYDRMVENALRGVVREALALVGERGLPGNHHFYISFRTDHAGVEMPEYLRMKYPEEITIVLQYQFWALETEGEQFSVVLSFNDRRERLVVPYAAMTGFADPSVKFALRFQGGEGAEGADAQPKLPAAVPASPRRAGAPEAGGEPAAAPEPAAPENKVVALDQFRKK